MEGQWENVVHLREWVKAVKRERSVLGGKVEEKSQQVRSLTEKCNIKLELQRKGERQRRATNIF